MASYSLQQLTPIFQAVLQQDCAMAKPYEQALCAQANQACRLDPSSVLFRSAVASAKHDKQLRFQLATVNFPANTLRCDRSPLRGETPAAVMAKEINASGDIASWGQPNLYLIQTIMEQVKKNQDPVVRLELLQALGTAPIPIYWVPTIMNGLKAAEELLATQKFPDAYGMEITNVRAALAKGQREVTGRIQEVVGQQALANVDLNALAAQLQLPELPGYGPALPAPAAWWRRDWKPLAALGLATVAALGLALVFHRRSA